MTAIAASPTTPAGLSHTQKCRLGRIKSSSSSLSSSKFLGFSIPCSNSNRRRHHLVVLPRAQKEEKDALQKQKQSSSFSITLDDVNPVGLGRRSRQIFDEVWRKFSGLGQISRTTRTDDSLDTLLIREVPMCEFTIPGAQNTTVLVVGVTSRIGRIVVRKLMLRGYNVKALVRKADQDVLKMLPRSVEVVVGDVGEPSTLKAAVEGCNKIIYCATARSNITGDLLRVDHQGVYNISKAFQDYNNRLAQSRAGKLHSRCNCKAAKASSCLQSSNLQSHWKVGKSARELTFKM